MSGKEKNKGFRWMIVNESKQSAILSIRLNFLNILLFIISAGILIFGLMYLLLQFTAIPQHFSTTPALTQEEIKDKKILLELNEKLSRIEDSVTVNDIYLKAISHVVHGNLKAAEVDSLMAKQSPVLLNHKSLKASKEDSLFRAQIAQEELNQLKTNPENSTPLLFPPVRGIVTASYDLIENHLATDIAAAKGDDIKSIEKGIVIFTEWTPDAGNIIMVQHPNEMISTYKHCSQLYKEIGDEVDKGEVIAAVGNGGELTTGPHLHFELWIQGKAIDAEDFINF